MGKFIELIFQKIYLAMLASGIFLVLTLCGGVLFGLAPASTVLMTLFAQYRYDYKAYKWQEAWSLFKENFLRSNQVFYTLLSIEAVFLYGLYLLVQLPQSILTVIISILNLLLALLLPLAYAVYLKLQVYFELSYINSIKLSFIGMFLNVGAMFKIAFGTAMIMAIFYYMPALVFFVFLGAWHFFISDLLEPVYQLIASRLVDQP